MDATWKYVCLKAMDRKEWKEWTAGVVVTGRTGLRNHLLRALYGKSDIARVVCTAMAILGILPGESSPGNSKFPRNLAALEILSVDSQETWNCCHQMSDFKAKMHQIRFRLGLRPRPRSLSAGYLTMVHHGVPRPLLLATNKRTQKQPT